MRISVSGARGMLGEEFVKTLSENHEVIPFPDREKVDISDVQAVLHFIRSIKPDVIVHCAAVRDPDPCELDKDMCWRINCTGTLAVAMAARELGCEVVHISSDAVFASERDEPYHEYDIPTTPQTIYGQSKLEAERIIQRYLQKYFILRVPLLFARTGGLRKNNLAKMFEKVRNGEKTNAMADAFSSVCYCYDIARATEKMIETDYWGIYHVTSDGAVSRAGLMKAALEAAGKNTSFIGETLIADAKKPAQRRRYVTLRSLLLEPVFGIKIPDWHESIRSCVEDLRLQGLVD
jgi:dTDP-4-dehydrorhamnose reductase